MTKLNHAEKQINVFGFAAKKSIASKKSFLSNVFSKKISPLFYNSALVGMSLIPEIINLYDNIVSLNNSENIENDMSFNSDKYIKNNFSRASNSIRPTMKFAPYSHRSSISFGLPWYN